MSWKRAVLAIGLWSNAAVVLAIAADWILSSHYRRDRLARLLDHPELFTGVSPHLWALAFGVVVLIAAGALALVWAARFRRAS
jgi:hypothetical protein